MRRTGAGWPLGAPGGFLVAWRLIWPAAFFYHLFYYYLFFAFPMCQSDNFRLWHSLIIVNRLVLTGSAALHGCSLPPSNSFEYRWVDARDSRKERKQPEETVKCSEITNLFRASSAGQFHLLHGIVLSLLTYLSIKLLAPVRLSVAPHYYHQSEYCAKGHHYRLESYINKFSRQIFTWIYWIEREGAWANRNTKIPVSPKIQQCFQY